MAKRYFILNDFSRKSIISPSIQEPSFNYLPLNVNVVGNFDSDFWTLNGKKNHIINGSISEKFLTIVKTGNTNSLKDLTFFIIESDLENLDGKEYPFVDGTELLNLNLKILKLLVMQCLEKLEVVTVFYKTF